MNYDIFSEITFKTARSGGSGGQNVNKVESMVDGYWLLNASILLNDDQKHLLREKLANRMDKEGFVRVRSQVHRSQLANKEEVTRKFNELIKLALEKKKLRIASKPSKAAKVRRLESKKRESEKKASRRFTL